jgi:hypothetical protein
VLVRLVCGGCIETMLLSSPWIWYTLLLFSAGSRSTKNMLRGSLVNLWRTLMSTKVKVFSLYTNIVVRVRPIRLEKGIYSTAKECYNN